MQISQKIASTQAPQRSLSAEPPQPVPPIEQAAGKRPSTFRTGTPADRHEEEPSNGKERFPTRQEIERRAYEIYARRVYKGESPTADWLVAEKELTARY